MKTRLNAFVVSALMIATALAVTVAVDFANASALSKRNIGSIGMLVRAIKSNQESDDSGPNVVINPQGIYRMLNVIFQSAEGATRDCLQSYLSDFEPSKNLQTANFLIMKKGGLCQEKCKNKLSMPSASFFEYNYADPVCRSEVANAVNETCHQTTNGLISCLLSSDELNNPEIEVANRGYICQKSVAKAL